MSKIIHYKANNNTITTTFNQVRFSKLVKKLNIYHFYSKVMSDKMKSQEKRKFDFMELLKGFLLLAFGTLLGIFGNQFFFKRNKEYEVKTELSKNLYYEQYQIINRILDFARVYSIEDFLDQKNMPISYTGVKGDTLSQSKYDSINMFRFTTYKAPGSTSPIKIVIPRRVPPPSFVTSPVIRKRFLEDFEFILANKDKIDFRLYEQFKEVIKIIDNHPFPNTFDPKELLKCSWCDKNLQSKWEGTLFELYFNACGRLRFDGEHYWLIN